MTGADGKPNVTHREMLQVFDEVVQEIKNELKQRGQENKFVGARVGHLRFTLGKLLTR
jgi:adenosine deaminase CECR1